MPAPDEVVDQGFLILFAYEVVEDHDFLAIVRLFGNGNDLVV